MKKKTLANVWSWSCLIVATYLIFFAPTENYFEILLVLFSVVFELLGYIIGTLDK